jgi:hypothetical protein
MATQKEIRIFDSENVKGVRLLLRGLIFSYVIGWTILAILAVPLPNFEYPYPIWRTLSIIMVLLTMLLAIKLDLRSLYIWATIGTLTALTRASAFLLEGTWNAFGVWLLVISGIIITSLSVVSVNALTGHINQEFTPDQ